jgi:ferric-dicitrate binding protein FerR (iron transport regulator)
MSGERLAELLARWEDDELSSQEMDELAGLLEADGSARAQLVNEFMLTAGISRSLREPAAGAADVRPPGAQAVRAVARRRRSSSRIRKRTTKKAAWLKYGAAPLAAAAAVLLAAHFYNLRRGARAREAVVVEVRGAVEVVSPDGARLRQGDRLAPGGKVLVGTGGSAKLRYDDGSVLGVSDETRFRLEKGGEGKAVYLGLGTIAVDAARQPAGAPMTLRTRQARARVLGTRFRLRAKGERTRLEVEEGRVLFTEIAGNQEVEVVTDHFAVAAAGRRLVPGRLSNAAKRLAETEEKIRRAYEHLEEIRKKPRKYNPRWMDFGRIFGFVIDAETGEVPAGVTIVAVRGGTRKKAVFEDARWEWFEIQSMKPGKWRIEARAPAYRPEVLEGFEVKKGNGPGMCTRLILRLERAEGD